MKDQKPELSKQEKFPSMLSNLLHEFENVLLEKEGEDEAMANQMFDEAVKRVKDKSYLETVDSIRQRNITLGNYLEALLKTIKGRINLSDPEIQKELIKNLEEISARQESPVIEVDMPQQNANLHKRFLPRRGEGERFSRL
jgi:hypothetical protein